MKKRILTAALAVLLIFGLVTSLSSCGGTSSTLPDAESANGKIDGTEILWAYDAESKTLTINGSGVIPSFSSAEAVPWYSVRHCIEKIDVSNGITAIGDFAFYYTPKLTDVKIPDGVATLGKLSFAFCSSVKAIALPDGLTSIGYGCFEACIALEGMYVPASVTDIGERAFASCSALKEVIVMGQISELKALTFNGCKSVEMLCFNAAVKNITVSDTAFEGCSKTFANAEFTESLSGKATLTVNYLYADKAVASEPHVEELEYGASYSIVSPSIEGYTPSQLTVTGIVSSFNTVVDVIYNQNSVETEAETEAETQPVERTEEGTSVGTIVAVAILVVVIAGIVVLAVFMMRSDKKNVKGRVSDKKRK